MNIIMQLILGVLLEVVHKFWRIGPLYILGVGMGALMQASMDPYVVLVGASGGGYALITAHLSNVIIVSFPISIRKPTTGNLVRNRG